MVIRKHTAVLATIGLADLASTLYLVTWCDAGEANPMMARLLERSPILFAVAKIAILVVGLGIIEYAWRKQPAAALRAAKAGIVGYLALYAVGVFHANNVEGPPRYGTRAAQADQVWERIREQIRTRHANPPAWALPAESALATPARPEGPRPPVAPADA